MIITADILKDIAPGSKKTNYILLEGIAEYMNVWFPAFGIDTKGELCHFISQAAHETDSFNTLEEYASGKAYEGRHDLGNYGQGDGVKYKGRGIFQTTGKVNYQQLEAISRKYFKGPVQFMLNPKLLLEPNYAVWSAGIYWDDRDFNTIANMPDDAKIWSKKLNKNLSPIEYITWRINGGFTNLSNRIEFYNRSKNIITS